MVRSWSLLVSCAGDGVSVGGKPEKDAKFMQCFSACDVDKNVPLQEECASCKSVDQGGAVSCHATLGWLVIANKGPAPSSPPPPPK